MNLDKSFEIAKALFSDIKDRLAEIETEQDARVQIINRIITEVLGWNFSELKTEKHSDAGYADYLLTSSGRSRLVIEAKRIGPIILNTSNQEMATYKVGGPALTAAMSGIKQAVSYCVDHGAAYGALTTGIIWIAFLPFPIAGIPYTEGTAYVFPSIDSILKNFAVFYDLFSRNSVIKRDYDVHFTKASGLTTEVFEPLVAANKNEYIRLLQSTQLATDLEPIFREFFGDLSGNNDPEMLTECFVETRESRYADASLEKIIRSISSSITPLEPSTKSQLAGEIKSALESGRGETVVIVGNDGAGKSTFLERFFRSVLETPIRKKCALIKIDISKWPGDLAGLSPWITTQLKSNLENLLYADGMPSYDELQGLYWREYQSWMRGQHKPLYETDKNRFKIEFGNFLDHQINHSQYDYVLRILDDVVRNRKMLPCLIFDNGDAFDFACQEAVFQYAQTLRENISFSFVVTPVTDRSFWRLSKGGPFQKFPSKIFYLPVPPTKEVLEKRVAYLQRKIDGAKEQTSYFLSKGIRLTVENIRGFAACLEEIFVREDFISRRVSWLANNSLEKCLALAQSIILSPIFSVEDLVKSFIAHGKKSVEAVSYRKFMQALLHGSYNAFQQDYNNFVWNVFAISPNFPTSPFLVISILKMLIDSSAAEDIGADGYVSVEQVNRYFVSAGVSESAIDHTLSTMLRASLIQPYDSSKDTIEVAERIAITHSGRVHYEMATVDPFFVSDMAFATPLRSLETIEGLRRLRDSSSKMTADTWKRVQKLFFEHLFDQDGLLVRLPHDGIYQSQRLLREELHSRWIEHRGMQLADPDHEAVPSTEADTFSHKSAVVSWYDAERGFGFLDAGLSRDVFIHRSLLEQSGIDIIRSGDRVICDIAPVPKGKLEAITIHSVQGAEAGENMGRTIEGIIDFWNKDKGYGFVKTATLDEDVYISIRTNDGQFADKLRYGCKVVGTVVQRRFGKLAYASIDNVT